MLIRMRTLVLLALLLTAPTLRSQAPAQMDRDLLEVSVPQLEELYRGHRYTVRQVVQWHLDRIARYDSVYKTMTLVDREAALRRADELDAQLRRRSKSVRGLPLFGVPIVIKANMSVTGWPTSAGWKGFVLPGHELIAPRDTKSVANLKAAGAVLLGQTNMPDFAASDTTNSSVLGRTGDAYDPRFSPGGSSGGTATGVAASFAVLGTGTDTANSIRQPAANNSLVGFLPTRGLTSIAGIEPLDWMRDNTGPLARDVTSAAIALATMQGSDPLDAATTVPEATRPASYLPYLKHASLKGKRFAVPWFVLEGSPSVYKGDKPPFHGGVVPETRAAFMAAVEQLRAAGATVLISPQILPESFNVALRQQNTRPYRKEGLDSFLRTFGPAQYHSVAEYEAVTGNRFPPFMVGGIRPGRDAGAPAEQRLIESDPEAEKNFFAPQRAALAEYVRVMGEYRLDGFVYPALQEPTYDETVAGASPAGPSSETGWVNRIGVPAVSLPGGFYASGMPFGLEISGMRWHDGELLGIAFAYEQATHNRRPPVLQEPK